LGLHRKRRPAFRFLNAAFPNVTLWSIVQVVGSFLLGYAFKWWTGRLSGRAADVREALQLLGEMSRNAEAAAHGIIAGAPDQGLSAGVMADRTTLGIQTRRCLGSCATFGNVSSCFAIYATSLSCADPQFGCTTQASIDQMRDAERGLDAAIRRTAATTLSWRLYAHERT
jgi:hypothetical protein